MEEGSKFQMGGSGQTRLAFVAESRFVCSDVLGNYNSVPNYSKITGCLCSERPRFRPVFCDYVRLMTMLPAPCKHMGERLQSALTSRGGAASCPGSWAQLTLWEEENRASESGNDLSQSFLTCAA